MQVKRATSPRNLRKAAILLASLEAEHAAALLRQMTPAQAAALQQAVESLGPIEADEQGEVIEEFFLAESIAPSSDAVGIELDAVPASTLAVAGLVPANSGESFRALSQAPPRKLVPFLKREHPQTMALVISHLPADRAAEVLALLPGALQVDVARRLVDLEETNPEVLREVERGLEAWLTAQEQSHRGQPGVSALASILSAADPRARQQILDNLSRHDRSLADQLDEPSPAAPWSFADLESLDSPSLVSILERADAEVLVLALAGAPPRFAERALELLGNHTPALEHGLSHLGPTRMSDIEEAQAQIVELARQLDQRGEIKVDPRSRLSLAI